MRERERDGGCYGYREDREDNITFEVKLRSSDFRRCPWLFIFHRHCEHTWITTLCGMIYLASVESALLRWSYKAEPRYSRVWQRELERWYRALIETWGEMKGKLKEKYLLQSWRDHILEQLNNLHLGSISIQVPELHDYFWWPYPSMRCQRRSLPDSV